MRPMTRFMNFSALALMVLSAGCASLGSAPQEKQKASSTDSGKSARAKAGNEKSTATATGSASATASAPAAKGTATMQSSVGFVTTTFANEETFAGQLVQPRLEDVLRELEQGIRERNDDGGILISYLVFRRLSGSSRDFLSVLEKRGSTASSRDPWILIECAYTALLRRDYGMAQYLLDSAEAVGRGRDKVAAGVMHARGLMFYTQKKTVLAMAAFREAAKQNYEPAILTLTFFSLRAGDHEGALSQLSRLKDSGSNNLNVKAALGIAHRLAGKPEEAVEYLSAVQRARPNDRRAIWNLALATSQIPSKRKEAIALLEKFNQSPGTSADLDARARGLFNKLQNLEDAARAEAAKAKPAAGATQADGAPTEGEKSEPATAE